MFGNTLESNSNANLPRRPSKHMNHIIPVAIKVRLSMYGECLMHRIE